MKKAKKSRVIILVVLVLAVIALLTAAYVRTDIYNKTDRILKLAGSEVYNMPDYSGIEVELSKTPGGWSTVINDIGYDAYTLNPAISNPSGEEILDYRMRVDVKSDVYFITAWCGTIEFHQGMETGVEKVQTIDLRNRPEYYIVDTIPSDDNPLIPLYKGDYFVYIPSSIDGEAPLADGATVTPGIMYYEAQGAEEVFKYVPPEKKEVKTAEDEVVAALSARSSTWTKVFDLDGAGNTEPNYQAYTYDLTITNNSDAVISDYKFTFSFGTEAYMASAWNGSLEFNQSGKTEYVADLRSFDASKLSIKTVNVDGEDFIALGRKDYFIYTPSSSEVAREVPIKAGEASVPGFIVYLAIGDELNNANFAMHYKLQKAIYNDNLFRMACIVAFVTIILALMFLATAIQRRRFEAQHAHDGKIISESIETFTGFIDAKDPYTNGHSRRVAEYTKLIASKLGYEGDELDRIYYVALLHDCGKIGVADNILTKPGRLTDEEFEQIKEHTLKGRDILSNFKSIDDVTEGAVYHHERYDGKGYPEGLAGEAIPKIARIICVADSFDAMNTDRCYRPRLSREKIVSELENNKGKQFDPKIADIMLGLIENREIII